MSFQELDPQELGADAGGEEVPDEIREMIREAVRGIAAEVRSGEKRSRQSSNVEEIVRILRLTPETVVYMQWVIEDLIEAGKIRGEPGIGSS